MSVIVVGTIDSMGASNKPKNALPVMNEIYVAFDASPSQTHAMPMRTYESM